MERVPQLLQETHDVLDGLRRQTETICSELTKPFPYAKDLEQKEERMTVLLNELAEAEKEQSAQRALRKTTQAQPIQDDKSGANLKSITVFLNEYQPPPPSASAKNHAPELVH